MCKIVTIIWVYIFGCDIWLPGLDILIRWCTEHKTRNFWVYFFTSSFDTVVILLLTILHCPSLIQHCKKKILCISHECVYRFLAKLQEKSACVVIYSIDRSNLYLAHYYITAKSLKSLHTPDKMAICSWRRGNIFLALGISLEQESVWVTPEKTKWNNIY